MQIIYIHGAGGSEHSFQWLRDQVQQEPQRFFNYPIEHDIARSVQRLNKLLDLINKPTILVGHSLGGLLATACVAHPNVSMLVTLNAPYGGIYHATLLSWFTTESLIHDLRPYSMFLSAVRSMAITRPHLAIVGTSGMPFFFGGEENDGVLTLASQTMLPNTKYEALPLNHMEVLLSPDVAGLINRFIERHYETPRTSEVLPTVA